MRHLAVLLLGISVVVGSCGQDSATPPTTGSEHLPAYVEAVDLIFLESYPVQVRAVVSGTVPTPCHAVDWEYDTVSSIAPAVLVFSTVEPGVTCVQVLEPFEITIDLGSYETGDHVAVINGTTYPFTI